MSAQGGTLQRRGTIELPIWPVAVLVVAAVAAAIGMTVLRDAGQTRFVRSVTESERFANSTAAVREQGAVAPTIDLTNSGVAINEAPAYVGFENPGAYIREAPAYVGLENPAAYGTAWDSIGGPNEALHRQYSPPQEGAAPKTGSNPIMVNGEACMQCR